MNHEIKPHFMASQNNFYPGFKDIINFLIISFTRLNFSIFKKNILFRNNILIYLLRYRILQSIFGGHLMNGRRRSEGR